MRADRFTRCGQGARTSSRINATALPVLYNRVQGFLFAVRNRVTRSRRRTTPYNNMSQNVLHSSLPP